MVFYFEIVKKWTVIFKFFSAKTFSKCVGWKSDGRLVDD